MTSKLCCTSGDRSDSPDAPNARHPVIEPRRHLLPHTQMEIDSYCQDTITSIGSESQELRDMFDESSPCIPSYHEDHLALKSGNRAFGKLVKSASLDSDLFRRLKSRLSKDWTNWKKSPDQEDSPPKASESRDCENPSNKLNICQNRRQQLVQNTKDVFLKRSGKSVANQTLGVDLLSDRTPSKGGYDSDAHVMGSSDILENMLPDNLGTSASRGWHAKLSYRSTDSGNDSTRDSTIRWRGNKISAREAPKIAELFNQDKVDTPKSSNDVFGDSLSSNASPSSRTRSDFCVQIPPFPPFEPPKLPSLTNSSHSLHWRCSVDSGRGKGAATTDFENLDPVNGPLPSIGELHNTRETDTQLRDIPKSLPSPEPEASSTGITIADKLQDENDVELKEASRHECGDVSILSPSAQDTKDDIRHGETKSENDDRDAGLETLEASNSSIHLQDMRISQHLRSFSDLTTASSNESSKERKAKRPSSPVTTVSIQKSTRRAQRKSSSGFQSIKVPEAWGKVVRRQSRSLHPLRTSGSASSGTNRKAKTDSTAESPAVVPKVKNNQVIHPSIASVLQENTTQCDKSPLEQLHENEGSNRDVERRPDTKVPNNKPTGPSLETSSLKRQNVNRRQRKYLQAVDGPADFRLNSSQPSKRNSISGLSMGSNYEEAAALWEKAFMAHQEQQEESMRTARSSISSLFRGSRTGDIGRSSISHEDATNKIDSGFKEGLLGSQATQLQPLNLEHTFDRLQLPGRASVSQPASPVMGAQDYHAFPEMETNAQRRRASSQPATNEDMSSRLPDAVMDRLESPRTRPFLTNAPAPPDITVTDLTVSQTSYKKSQPKLIHSSGGLGAWGRYPSHTRNERVLSAGITDNVITRDFAPHVNVISDEDTDDSLKAKRQRKRRKKARSMMLRKKIFTDLPSFFKSRSTGFRRAERGHRSSITVGGDLEFPELEMLAPSEPFVPVARVEQASQPSSVSSKKSLSAKGWSTEDEPSSNKLRLSTIGSSHYGSSEDHSLTLSGSQGSRPCASDYSKLFAMVSEGQRGDGTEHISPLDGSSGTDTEREFFKIRSASSSSSPLDFSSRQEIMPSVNVRKAISAEVMRTSTHDLCKMLEENEEWERLKAIKAAEVAWDE